MNPIEVSAGLIFREGKLLITQRRTGDHLGGLWEFPGGKREGEETDQACLQRELREELGVQVAVHELVDTITHRYPEKTVCLKFFRCSVGTDEPRAIACNALAWVDAVGLGQYAFPEADAQLLKKLGAASPLWNFAAPTR